MFSGMFTHLIKPALTLHQAKELFGLLGYQASSPNEEEELVLNSKLVPADFLLRLACGFFTARMECQLLLSALGSVDRGVEWVLQLVKERQASHSLQVALENTKSKSDAASVSDAILAGGMDAELDLYTEQADASHMTSTSCSPPNASYLTPKETDLSKPFQKEPYRSDIGNNEDARQGKSLNNPCLMERFAEDQSEADAHRQVCRCITQGVLYIYQCEKCKEFHSSFCSCYKECMIKGHTLALCPYKAEDLYSTQEQLRLAMEKSKDSMKTHHCMANSTSDLFFVCYDCQLIHEHNCNIVTKCTNQKHIMQPTGKIQPPQEERVNAQKRHKCLSSGAPVYLICHTCNNTHDILCQDTQNCVKNAHRLQYSQEPGASETPYAPIPYHLNCWTGNQPVPETVCLTCKVFHFSGCPDGWHCSQKHTIQDVGMKCSGCFSSELFTLCRYCGALYCNRCCFKNAMSCKCGKPLSNSSSV